MWLFEITEPLDFANQSGAFKQGYVIRIEGPRDMKRDIRNPYPPDSQGHRDFAKGVEWADWHRVSMDASDRYKMKKMMKQGMSHYPVRI